jgi:carbonic anhydrase
VGSGDKGETAEKADGGEKVAAGEGSGEKPGEKAAAGEAAGAGREASAQAQPPGDAGVADGGAGDNADHALEELRSVVAKATASAKSAAAAGSAPAGVPQWSYDGKTGPAAWGQIEPAWRACSAGKAQSPIDIEPKAGVASPIVFHYRPTPATVSDDGRLLQVRLEPGSTIELGGRVYQLLRLDFHMPSEHSIAGEHYPLEVQLLHQDNDGRLAMIAVLYDQGAESKVLAGLWARWPRKPASEDKARKPFDPTGLLPETRTVFRYTGSLTTPPCTEGVVWSVMRRAMSDSKAHLEEYAKHYPHTAREPQPLGERKIE